MLRMDLEMFLNSFNKHKRNGIIHVGGHHGQEIPLYNHLGFQRILIFEPLEDAWKKIPVESNVYKIKAAVGDKTGKATMHVNRVLDHDGKVVVGESSSLLKPKNHLVAFPDVHFSSITEEVDVVTLDRWFLTTTNGLQPTDFSCLILDAQGYEDRIILGAESLLKNIDVVYSEIAITELYENNAKLDTLDSLLYNHGFKRIHHWLYQHGCGEAIYIKL